MHLYFEESGTAAPLTRPSAHRHLIMVVLTVPNRDKALQAIKSLRDNLKFHREFKRYTPIGFQTEVLQLAKTLDISFTATVVDKQNLKPEWQRARAIDFYGAVAGELIKKAAAGLRNAILIVDKINEVEVRRLKKIIREEINPSKPSKRKPKKIKKTRGYESSDDDILQLAHVVAWSIFRWKERGDSRLFEVIAGAIEWHKFSGERK